MLFFKHVLLIGDKTLLRGKVNIATDAFVVNTKKLKT